MRGRWVYVGSPSGPDGKGGAAQVLSVHAALLPVGTTGKIVYFSGSQWVLPENWEMIENKANFQLDPNYPTAKREIDHSRVYDCSTQQVSIIPSPDVDLFCSGHALLPNGHLLIAGGTQHFPPPDERAELHHAHWSGSRETWIFDPNLLEIRAAIRATVTALVPRENHIDLFVTGTDGAVWSTFFEPDSVGWRGWFLIHPEVKMQPGATVTALVPRENHIDLFVTGTDGAVWSTFFEPDPVGWRGWFLLIIAGYPWIKGPLLNRDPGQTESGQPMGGGRWYPTLITLADGRVMVMCGHPLIAEFTTSSTNFDIRHNNTKPEVYDPRTNTWMLINKPLGADQTHNFAPYYPRLHIIPHTGEVFIVQPLYSSQIRDYVPQDPRCRPTKNGGDGLCSENPLDTNPPYTTSVKDNSLFYNVSTQDVTRAFPGPQTLEAIYLNPGFTSQETTSVLLPLLHEENYHPRVLICGGVQSLIADLSPDSTVPLQWKATAPRLLKTIRMYANSTLLPTGDVVVTGGVTKGIDPGNHYTAADGVKTVEIYRSPSRDNPDFWTLGPVAGETRGYHSVALLMPDGRVWTAGSEENANQFVPNLAIELLEPDYFQVPDRVVITDSPRSIVFGKSFTVRFHPTTTNTPISRVVLMRLGSATHAFDGDQRYVSIPFKQEGTTLTVECPSDSTIAPPGYYMLWLIDANNLPCKLAPFVRVAFS